MGGAIAFYPELYLSLSASRMENDTFVMLASQGLTHDSPLARSIHLSRVTRRDCATVCARRSVLVDHKQSKVHGTTIRFEVRSHRSDKHGEESGGLRTGVVRPKSMETGSSGEQRSPCHHLQHRRVREGRSGIPFWSCALTRSRWRSMRLQFPKRVSRMMWRWPDNCGGFVQAYNQHPQLTNGARFSSRSARRARFQC